jgi:hypothetical protein
MGSEGAGESEDAELFRMVSLGRSPGFSWADGSLIFGFAFGSSGVGFASSGPPFGVVSSFMVSGSFEGEVYRKSNGIDLLIQAAFPGLRESCKI